MPLIMITGYPSSGKTMRALALKKELEQLIDKSGSNLQVKIINDELLKIPKESYRESLTEKSIRGQQMSAVKRGLDKSTIVILDNLTYIKGFRYQLFCEAKALQTNSCVVHVGAPIELCKMWNSARLESEQWPSDLFDALTFRYEEPNGHSRWDSPLFVVTQEDTGLPVNEIWETVILKKAKPPNQATILKPATPSNYLTELDSITLKVTNEMLDLHKSNPGATVRLSEYADPIELPVRLTVPDINRMRRNFIALNKMKPIEMNRIKERYVEFLIKQWERDL
jgi:protein KTI12